MHGNTGRGAEKHLSLAKGRPQPLGEDDCKARAVHVSPCRQGYPASPGLLEQLHTHKFFCTHGCSHCTGLGMQLCAGLAAPVLLLPLSNSPGCQ